MCSGADNTGIQTVGVIVDVHRGQARSHKDLRRSVGASPLAKKRGPRAFRRPALSLTSIASRLAPTGICVDL